MTAGGAAAVNRRRVLIFWATIGFAVGAYGLAWHLGLPRFARCGTDDRAWRQSLGMVTVGFYVGCIAPPVLWKRSADHKILRPFLFGLAVVAVTAVGVLSSGSEMLVINYLALGLPVLGLLIIWRGGRVPGRVGGYILGVVTPLALILMLFVLRELCD